MAIVKPSGTAAAIVNPNLQFDPIRYVASGIVWLELSDDLFCSLN
jgi:hypothetical protein